MNVLDFTSIVYIFSTTESFTSILLPFNRKLDSENVFSYIFYYLWYHYFLVFWVCLWDSLRIVQWVVGRCQGGWLRIWHLNGCSMAWRRGNHHIISSTVFGVGGVKKLGRRVWAVWQAHHHRQGARYSQGLECSPSEGKKLVCLVHS